MSENKLVLYGAGAAGRYAIKHLATKGIIPVALVDSDSSKWGTRVEGLKVMSPADADRAFNWAQWVACAISRPAATEIRQIIREMGVRTKPLWECIPVCHGVPSDNIRKSLAAIVGHADTTLLVNDQCIFRRNADYGEQISPSPISELYFPDFITHRDDEHFVDCGACDGDTVKAFMERWASWSLITAFEPDKGNYEKLRDMGVPNGQWIDTRNKAVGDARQILAFQENGDWSSHISTHPSQAATTMVECVKLDDTNLRIPPTYIKMDIEGAELEALWGARKIIRDHSPVMAICAYHTSDHLWQIPMLVKAINPDYTCRLQRYAEGAFELVWYFVPPERIKA